MDVWLLMKSMLIGVSIAAPVGPIGILCIQRTLGYGGRIGFISGLGAACADAVYGAIGAFGMAAVTAFLSSLAVPMALGGAVFLAWMGGKLLFEFPERASMKEAGPAKKVSSAQAFFSVFILTLANPVTILSFIAIFATLGGATVLPLEASLVMVVGVFFGSSLWWLSLAVIVSAIRQRMGAGVRRGINIGSGLTLMVFAVWQVASLLL